MMHLAQGNDKPAGVLRIFPLHMGAKLRRLSAIDLGAKSRNGPTAKVFPVIKPVLTFAGLLTPAIDVFYYDIFSLYSSPRPFPAATTTSQNPKNLSSLKLGMRM
jgi:hypothetical protein